MYVCTSSAVCKYCKQEFRYVKSRSDRSVCDVCKNPRTKYHIKKRRIGLIHKCRCGKATEKKGTLCLSCKNDIHLRILNRKCLVCEVPIINGSAIYCSRKCINTASYILSSMRKKLDKIIAQ